MTDGERTETAMQLGPGVPLVYRTAEIFVEFRGKGLTKPHENRYS